MMQERFDRSFFERDVLEVAPELTGSVLSRKYPDGRTETWTITEVEAYRGEEDRACHANRGLTPRTRIMYGRGGHLYMYLIYGMYWMLNVVTGKENQPQAVLIRGLRGVYGPGRLTRRLALDRGFYGEDLCESGRIWIGPGTDRLPVQKGARIGIDYAGDPWVNLPWRFYTETREV